jgi:hypothetical protein
MSQSNEATSMRSVFLSLGHRILFPRTRTNSPVLLLALVVSISLIYTAFTPRVMNHGTTSTQNPQSVTFEQAQEASTPENAPETAPAPQFEPSTDPSTENPVQSVSGAFDSSDSSVSTMPSPSSDSSETAPNCVGYNCDATDPPLPDGCNTCAMTNHLGSDPTCAMYCRALDNNY